jgi:hypothetical protein
MFLRPQEPKQDTSEWVIQYVIFNTGGTRAIVDKIRVFVFWYANQHVHSQGGKLVPMNPDDFKTEFNIADSYKLKAGQFKELRFDLDPEWSKRIAHLTAYQRQGITNPEIVGYISVAGEIEYLDDSKVRRIVGISRKLDFTAKRFVSSNDSDFEYAD